MTPRVGDFPEVDEKGQEKWPKGDEKTWKAALRGITTGESLSLPLYPVTDSSADSPDISKSIVNHVQTSLARAPYNIDDFGAYQAAALSVRDNLIVSYDLFGCLSSHMHEYWRLLCRVPNFIPFCFCDLRRFSYDDFFFRPSLCALYANVMC